MRPLGINAAPMLFLNASFIATIHAFVELSDNVGSLTTFGAFSAAFASSLCCLNLAINPDASGLKN